MGQAGAPVGLDHAFQSLHPFDFERHPPGHPTPSAVAGMMHAQVRAAAAVLRAQPLGDAALGLRRAEDALSDLAQAIRTGGPMPAALLAGAQRAVLAAAPALARARRVAPPAAPPSLLSTLTPRALSQQAAVRNDWARGLTRSQAPNQDWAADLAQRLLPSTGAFKRLRPQPAVSDRALRSVTSTLAEAILTGTRVARTSRPADRALAQAVGVAQRALAGAHPPTAPGGADLLTVAVARLHQLAAA